MAEAIRIQHQHQEGEGEELRLKEAVVGGRCHRLSSHLAAVAEPIVGSIDSKQHSSGSLRMLHMGPSRCHSTAHIEQRSPSWQLQERFRLGHLGQSGSLTLKTTVGGYADCIRHSHRRRRHHHHCDLHHILHRSGDPRADRSRHSHAEEGFL